MAKIFEDVPEDNKSRTNFKFIIIIEILNNFVLNR